MLYCLLEVSHFLKVVEISAHYKGVKLTFIAITEKNTVKI